MTPATDPYRILGLDPGATPAEIKRAYRRLVKAYHPDSAGERALPRFLAIQAAYERLTGVQPGGPGQAGRDGSAGRRGSPPSPPPSRPWSAEAERARATREGFRQRSTRSGPRPGAPGAAGGPAGGAGPDRAAGAGTGTGGRTGSAAGEGPRSAGTGRGAGRRGRPKATIGSTSYDGAENEPFEPGWGGAGWYGAASGTYWTINPKEYADPRKHGPEYLARARRRRGGGEDDAAPEPGIADAPRPDEAPAARAGARPDDGAGRSDGAESPDPSSTVGPATTGGSRRAPRVSGAAAASGAQPGDIRRPTAPPADASPPIASAGADAGARADHEGPAAAHLSAGRFGALQPGRVMASWRGRLALAALAWFPLGLAIFGIHGEVTGCSTYLASCTDPIAWSVWIPQLIAFGLLVASPRLAWIAASGSLILLALTVPLAAILTTGSGGRPPSAGETGLLELVMAVGWLVGVGIALSGRIPLPPWRATRVR